jgi:hypothetical protein
LVNNSDEAKFSWFCEPGQSDWKFTKVKSEHHLLDVLIDVYPGFVGLDRYQSCEHKLNRTIFFKVTRDFWLVLVMIEAEKIARLLSYKHYKRDRDSHNFPWQELKELQKYLQHKKYPK